MCIFSQTSEMIKSLLIVLSLTLLVHVSYSQAIDKLLLADNEIPAGYKKSGKLMCRTVHAASFYEQADVYASMFGNVVKKEFQSFEGKGDKGSVLYFEFEKEFTGQAFLEGLLWGTEGKATKKKPDEYYSKGNVLVIWSFGMDSPVKKVSQDKVKSALN
jgi:hypothetical protein